MKSEAVTDSSKRNLLYDELGLAECHSVIVQVDILLTISSIVVFYYLLDSSRHLQHPTLVHCTAAAAFHSLPWRTRCVVANISCCITSHSEYCAT